MTSLPIPRPRNRHEARAVAAGAAITELLEQPVAAPDRPIWVRPKEATRLSGLGLTTIYALMARGVLISRKVGGARLISIASLERLGAGDE